MEEKQKKKTKRKKKVLEFKDVYVPVQREIKEEK